MERNIDIMTKLHLLYKCNGVKVNFRRVAVLACACAVVVASGGCKATNPPSIPEASGPLRPINVITTEQSRNIRYDKTGQ